MAAILVCDVVGYSRLMQADAEATLASLTAYREILTTSVAAQGGRVVNTPGDSVLAEFRSAQSALLAAHAAQTALVERNAGVAAAQRMYARMGIDLGEVLENEAGIYGDGVNVAARLQAVADPGGIAISRRVFDLVERHSPVPIRHGGKRNLKNIAEPVEVYRVAIPGAQERESGAKRLLRRLGRTGTAVAIAGTALVIAGLTGAIWLSVLPEEAPSLPVSTRGPGPGGIPGWSLDLPLPAEPFIAVLPFTSFGASPQQEALADGFTETLITDLANVPGLLVVARNTMFRYKGQATDPRELGRTLGVSHVLEGSVQASGSLLRINAQLIDARNNTHLWAERFDAPADDPFALQDRIANKIAQALDIQLVAGELAHLHASSTTNTEAANWLRRAELLWGAKTGGAPCGRIGPTRDMYYRSVAADPQFASGWAGLARHAMRDVKYLCPDRSDSSLTDALHSARRSLELDRNNAEALAILAQVRLYQRDVDAFLELAASAVRRGGGNAIALATIARSYLHVGLYDEASRLTVKAIRIHPGYPPWYLSILGAAAFWRGNLERAEEILLVATGRNANLPHAHLYLIATYQAGGRGADARRAVAALQGIRPDLTVDNWLEYAEPYTEPNAGRLRELLKGASLP